MYVKEIRR